MRNGKKRGWFNIILSAGLLAAVFCVMQKGITKAGREKSEAETVIIEEISMKAPENGEQAEAVPQKEIILEEEEEEKEWVKIDNADTGDAWVMPKIQIIYKEDISAEKRPEEMTKEEAAEIAVRYLESCFGLDCEGKAVHLSLIEQAETDYPRRYWGEVAGEDMGAFRFSIDSVNGRLINARQRIRASQEAIGLNDDEYENALKAYEEAIDKSREEVWLSTNEFMEMVNPITWTKTAKAIIRKNGLNAGKMINSATLLDYSLGCAIVECNYNELKEDREIVQLAIDIRTKELIYYGH